MIPSTVRDAVALQYQNADDAWVTVATCDLGAFLRTRRLAAPPGQTITARRWRVVKIGSHDFGLNVMSLRKIEVRRETAALSAHRRWSFDFDAGEQRYGLIVTDGNAEVFRRGERVASIPSPYGHEQVAEVRRAQTLDTLLAFHRDVPPFRFSRQGAHSEWDSRAVVFENVPIFDFDGTRAGGVNDEQQLEFRDYQAGDTFNLSLEGEVTTSIVYSTNMVTLAASVRAALENLTNVGAGGVTVTSPEDKKLKVVFVGKNRSDDVGELAPATLNSDEGGIRVATLVQGKPGGEPVMSVTRGWPAAGAFFQQRLVMAGLRDRPQTVLASMAGLYFNLRTQGAETNKGIDVEIATDESTPIMALSPGRHLQVFTKSAEFFNPPPFAPPPEFVRTSRVGLEPATPILEMDGQSLFIAAGGGTVYITAYDDIQQGYSATPLSSLASHIVSDITAAGFRRHRNTAEPNLGLFIRADGGAAVMSAMLSQEVLGWVPWTTDGAFTEAGGERAGDLYVCVRREADGVETNRLERLDERHMLDASVRGDGPAEGATGLHHLEGRTVALYLDGGDAGDAVVTDGAVTFPFPCQRSWEVGLLFTPKGRLLPMVLEKDPRAGASMRARVGEIAFNLGPTAALKAGMTGKAMWTVPLKRRPGALLDHGPGEDAFEGWTRLFPVPGFQDDAQIDFAQPRPGPLEIREIVLTITS
ncbi:MAG: hypothetical protein ACK4FB_09020 [Brevundimonas sp.]|uniref:hypothetical protein n=1 Tax=Brevundimonas sp. TaxID=1871086 RepID=UPI00391B3E15